MQLLFPSSLRKEESISFTVRRSKRRKRTMSISVSREGAVIVSVPFRTSPQDIQRFAISRIGWVENRLQKAAQRIRYKSLMDFVLDGFVEYLGAQYPVHIVPTKLLKKKGFCFLQSNLLIVQVPENSESYQTAEESIRQWYRTQAGKLFAERAAFFAHQIGVQFRAIKTGEHKSQWGSCNRRGIINLNWRIIMAPPEIVDYLVVHELCHLVHMNHSDKYWREVEKILPDYRERRAQLRLFERKFPLA